MWNACRTMRSSGATTSLTTFFYIDPPYWDCEDYYGKGFFSREDFGRLAELLAGVQGKFILIPERHARRPGDLQALPL